MPDAAAVAPRPLTPHGAPPEALAHAVDAAAHTAHAAGLLLAPTRRHRATRRRAAKVFHDLEMPASQKVRLAGVVVVVVMVVVVVVVVVVMVVGGVHGGVAREHSFEKNCSGWVGKSALFITSVVKRSGMFSSN